MPPDAAMAAFFANPADFRAWLADNHASARELLVGFHRKGSGIPSITWPESVDEALCYGWIDGVRRTIDEQRYSIRFTPRKPGSNWSAVNLRRMEELIAAGRVTEAGLRIYQVRRPDREAVYSFEQRTHPELTADEAALFQANPSAWSFLQALPPGFRRSCLWYVVSAKRPETRARRLAELVAACAEGRRLDGK